MGTRLQCLGYNGHCLTAGLLLYDNGKRWFIDCAWWHDGSPTSMTKPGLGKKDRQSKKYIITGGKSTAMQEQAAGDWNMKYLCLFYSWGDYLKPLHGRLENHLLKSLLIWMHMQGFFSSSHPSDFRIKQNPWKSGLLYSFFSRQNASVAFHISSWIKYIYNKTKCLFTNINLPQFH